MARSTAEIVREIRQTCFRQDDGREVTQALLAEWLGLKDAKTVGRWERGASFPHERVAEFRRKLGKRAHAALHERFEALLDELDAAAAAGRYRQAEQEPAPAALAPPPLDWDHVELEGPAHPVRRRGPAAPLAPASSSSLTPPPTRHAGVSASQGVAAVAFVALAASCIALGRHSSEPSPMPVRYYSAGLARDAVVHAPPRSGSGPVRFGPHVASGARHARQFPEKPFRGQMHSPCPSYPGHITVNGGCWWGGRDAPCAPDEFERDGKCWAPLPEEPDKPVMIEPAQ